jgi:hypothetical protein
MEDASAAFLTAVQQSMQAIRKAVGTRAGWLCREKENTAPPCADGMPTEREP